MLKATGLLIGLFFQIHALGSVSDSGGKIYKWTNNPWFLENTKEVKYCIHLDQNFGSRINFYKIAIRAALNDWKDMLQVAENSERDADFLFPYKSIKIGTQDFIEDCGEDTDIHFMLGNLFEDQREHFNSPRDFVGAAIRTAYDTKNLRSRGFVYIAPLQGALKPKIPNLPDISWDNQKLDPLFLVLLHHELGHVFGLTHASGYFMEPTLPEKAIAALAEREKGEKEKLPFYFGPSLFTKLMEFDSMDIYGCESDPIFTKKFQKVLHPTDPCGRIVVEGTSIKFMTSTFKTHGTDWNWVTRAKSSSSNFNSQAVALNSIYLPEDQTVFENNIEGKRKYFFETEWVIKFAKQNGVLEYIQSGKKVPFMFYFKQDHLTARSFFTQVDKMTLENILCLDLCFTFRSKE